MLGRKAELRGHSSVTQATVTTSRWQAGQQQWVSIVAGRLLRMGPPDGCEGEGGGMMHVVGEGLLSVPGDLGTAACSSHRAKRRQLLKLDHSM